MRPDLASAALCLLILIPAFYFFTLRRKDHPPHPPGPLGLPIIGNTRLPRSHAWKVYRQWSELYGTHLLLVVRYSVL